MLLNEDFLTHRMELIERLIAAQDKEGLIQVLQEDRDNIAHLQAELNHMRESIANINKVQQYVSCA